MHAFQELVRCHRLGHGPREVSRLLQMSPNSERKYRLAIQEAGLLDGDPEDIPDLGRLREAVERRFPPSAAKQRSSVEGYEAEIGDKLKVGAGAQAIYDYLRVKYEGEFEGSLSAVKRLCRRLKRDRGVDPKEVSIPVETPPGEAAQVDFGYLGLIYDPMINAVRKVWIFVMVLCGSRLMYVDLVFDQKVKTWLELHVRAFKYLGGAPRTMIPDNLKAAVIKAAFKSSDDCEINRSYRELARHYGFTIDPTPPYQPKKKGKVESGVKYVKHNFGDPRTFRDVDDAAKQLVEWLEKVANRRIHGTTRRSPAELFAAAEAEHLLPIPAARFDPVIWRKAKVHIDSHFQFEGRLYSVHFKNIGKEVWVRATAKTVEAYYDDDRLATHERRGDYGRSTIDGHLPDYRSEWAERGRKAWEARADVIGPAVGAYIRAVFDSDRELSMLRRVMSIVTHLEGFPAGRACAAAARAHYFGNYTSHGIRNILKKGLDLTEPSLWDAERFGALESPRHARKIMELTGSPAEVDHGSN